MDDAGNVERIHDLIRQNDPSALDLIYDTFGARLYRYVLVMLGDVGMSEDVLQNVFVRLAENRECLARVENLAGYLFIMARNLALNVRRSRAKKEENIEDYANILATEADDPGAVDDRDQLLKALLKLPLEQREVIAMKCWQDMTFDEIADSLKISLNTVASRYRYALKKLREHLMRGNNMFRL
ncbi:MAG: sigma-70 family RNA polymerase sigma factor [Verrucomicrobia bacterium]|nr:sigma-70 family RNA polymerase sigma factor [Verrucomicrobiota bacterium]MBU4292182.1 sigma-70 family RNA polymerase sigma factor [Verrucomicrobiota bacterium]MBU4428756.1 sigma-70 family RNA polymerase sigma factor [Verrucomicrobiota bacterium]MCG2681626.1 sigma-70 family RNA polymerase sigma factor [Kiritimatiellia bacterium]